MFTEYLSPDRYFSHEVTSKITNYRVQITVVSKAQMNSVHLRLQGLRQFYASVFPSLPSGNPALFFLLCLKPFLNGDRIGSSGKVKRLLIKTNTNPGGLKIIISTNLISTKKIQALKITVLQIFLLNIICHE